VLTQNLLTKKKGGINKQHTLLFWFRLKMSPYDVHRSCYQKNIQNTGLRNPTLTSVFEPIILCHHLKLVKVKEEKGHSDHNPDHEYTVMTPCFC